MPADLKAISDLGERGKTFPVTTTPINRAAGKVSLLSAPHKPRSGHLPAGEAALCWQSLLVEPWWPLQMSIVFGSGPQWEGVEDEAPSRI